MAIHSKAPYIDFTFEDNKYDLNGAYLSNLNIIKVYLPSIRTPSELFDTIEHESIHAGIDDIDFFGEEEHAIIDKVVWAEYLL